MLSASSVRLLYPPCFLNGLFCKNWGRGVNELRRFLGVCEEDAISFYVGSLCPLTLKMWSSSFLCFSRLVPMYLQFRLFFPFKWCGDYGEIKHSLLMLNLILLSRKTCVPQCTHSTVFIVFSTRIQSKLMKFSFYCLLEMYSKPFQKLVCLFCFKIKNKPAGINISCTF